MQKFHSLLPFHSHKILVKPIELHTYSSDASFYRYIPQLIIIPDNCDDIRKLILWCKSNNRHITFRAAGTSLSGQAQSDDILVDISKKWKKFEIDEKSLTVRTQPGVILGKINTALAKFNRKVGPDPASLNACMVGGVLANNSSGMSSGIVRNAYNTILSLSFILHNGILYNTEEKDSDHKLRITSPDIYNGLLLIKDEILSNPNLVNFIIDKYRLKNTIGYSLNSFLDYSKPIDILSHLMIGSEGTLGFISEAVLNTFPESIHKITGLAFFKDVNDTCQAIKSMKELQANVLEFMDRASLRSIEDIQGVPEIIKLLPQNTFALLFEFSYENENEKEKIESQIQQVLKNYEQIANYYLTTEPNTRANLWKIRQGLLSSISSMRKRGTAMIIEDFAFDLDILPNAILSLQELFINFDYKDYAIYGHGTDGNLHFLIAQSFNSREDEIKYQNFNEKLIDIVVSKYNGSLKAEHGSGRAMAPFIKYQWGDEAYNMMVKIKKLLDPDNIFNPDVIISNNEAIHLKNLKQFPIIESEIDKCIECGFCEDICPSKDLTITPRKRIALLREIERLKNNNSNLLDDIFKDYYYYNLDTCAVDGLCSMKCPIGINTADIVKKLRETQNSKNKKKIAVNIAKYFRFYEKSVKALINFTLTLRKITGDKFLFLTTQLIEKLYKKPVYKWNKFIRKPIKLFHTSNVDPDFIYFPCCISRIMGDPNDDKHKPISKVLIDISRKAGYRIMIPSDCEGYCCGMTFLSKGYFDTFKDTICKIIDKMWEWSEEGKVPIILDSSSCSYTIRSADSYLNAKTLAKLRKMKIFDINEYCYFYLINKLKLHKTNEKVILHPNCSVVKMGLTDKMKAIAEKCSSNIVIPDNLGCCGFAGDRGLLFPELPQNACYTEKNEVISENANLHFSSNITCEIAMTEATGKQYLSIIYLIDKVIEK